MNQQDFEELKKYTTKILTISDLNIVEKVRSLPKILQDYINIFTDELSILKELKLQQEKTYSKFYRYFKEDYKREIESKHEYDMYINSEDEYHVISTNTYKQEIIVKYLEETIDNIKKMSFNIKNWLEIKKYLDGN